MVLETPEIQRQANRVVDFQRGFPTNYAEESMSHSTLANRNHRRQTKQSRNGELNGSTGKHTPESSVLHSVRQLGSDVTRSMKAQAESFGQTATGYLKESRKRARALEQAAQRRIEQRPLTALLCAAGLGLLAGIFCARRR
jgi:ElaB/YqjD/DUF883 family membrane-anchored ribosome-binding protein